uniref:Sec-independent translocase component C n=1 Tax=Apophlaea sinclairii TaxID=212746 RepID=A0A1C9CBF4_9FLOR|nr:Sec-independent translocase component C [Apophlaea sinclairii]AOM65716.1 Sec-independent translocase component C [Apophlaea sinclairii]
MKFLKSLLNNTPIPFSVSQNNNLEQSQMSIYEHLEELRKRTIYIILWFLLVSMMSFIYIKDITNILQAPANGIKFLQLAPGEYFFVSVKISMFSGLLLSIPITLYQILLFISPGLTQQEKNIIIPVSIGSSCLFFIGMYFAYFFLEPKALEFLIHYGDNIIEPLWSFEQYFDFTLVFLLTTALVFQIPIIQILLGSLNIVSSQQMLSIWKYVILISTVIAAVITPSTDPFTQIILSIAVLLLYSVGIGLLLSFNK